MLECAAENLKINKSPDFPPFFLWDVIFWKVTSCKTAAITESRKWFSYVKWLCKIFASSAERSERQFSLIPNGPFQLDGKRFACLAPCVRPNGEGLLHKSLLRQHYLPSAWLRLLPITGPSLGISAQAEGSHCRSGERRLCFNGTAVGQWPGGQRFSPNLPPLFSHTMWASLR